MENKTGVIYILTNPSFPEYVKIGYADDIKKRLAQLNRSECVPFAFRVYATFETSSRLSDLKIHDLIDRLNPHLRAIENFEGKKRVREFYAMTKDDAYELLKSIAGITGQEEKLHKHGLTPSENKDEKLAEDIRKSHFTFKELGIQPGEEIEFIRDSKVKVKVIDDRMVEYRGETYYLSNLAKKLLNVKRPIQGPRYFKYKGKVLTDIRNDL